jgi:putative SOS response-associated peptidase YedK
MIHSRCSSFRRWQIVTMCNTYVARPKRAAQGLAQRVSEATARLASELVRKSDPGIVVQSNGRAELMRWGFQREFNPAINNARSDKLEGGMWRESFHERRCVIPMTLFYEWGPGSGGRKQAHDFRDPDDDYLWAAGIWEENQGLGPCYTMVTTAASPLMSPIHDRMPALIRSEEMQEWLAGSGTWIFKPFAEPLVVTPCQSPLARRGAACDIQQDLF